MLVDASAAQINRIGCVTQRLFNAGLRFDLGRSRWTMHEFLLTRHLPFSWFLPKHVAHFDTQVVSRQCLWALPLLNSTVMGV